MKQDVEGQHFHSYWVRELSRFYFTTSGISDGVKSNWHQDFWQFFTKLGFL
ncbi:hypothetical protein FDUTEX481_09825 [Tolypothrix sp. PCC 7601]|nr:hypothetical protein FDUTEX481_09825 [Tolypothrix sp. PCC 7601]